MPHGAFREKIARFNVPFTLNFRIKLSLQKNN